MIGKTTWLIPDLYLPESTSTKPYAGHESICVVNPNEEDCEIQCRFYFADRDPAEGFYFHCPANRSVHVKVNELSGKEGETIPLGVPYAAMLVCSVPIVVQCTRVDTTQENLALMTTIGYGY